MRQLKSDEIQFDNLTISWTGPSLDEGKMPALFYFALTGTESLTLDPFNQIVQFLHGEKLRVFSLTLPGHGEGLSPTKAIAFWAEEIRGGTKLVDDFVDEAKRAIDHLFDQNLISKVATAGLSRGGFIASHLAASDPRIESLLAFSPMIDLAYMSEFDALKNDPYVQKMHLSQLVDYLAGRDVRFYVGNRDVRVGTRNCFDFIEALTEKSYEKNRNLIPSELILRPSIGRDGHGTSPETFKDGAEWIKKKLL